MTNERGGPFRAIETRVCCWHRACKRRAVAFCAQFTPPFLAKTAFTLCLSAVAGTIALAQTPPAPETKGTIVESAPATTAPAALPAEAAPQPSSPEAQHVARYDEAIAAARAYQPSFEDAVRLRDAFAAIGGKNPAGAKAIRDQISDPVCKKMIDWYLYRQGIGTAREIRAFLDQNPTWPDRNLLAQRAEEAVFTNGGSVKDIKAFFGNETPKTGIGHAALASAYLAEQDTEKAKTFAAKAWRDLDIAASLEIGFLERFKSLLTEADHYARVDRLLLDNVRWDAERNDRAATIRRAMQNLADPLNKQKAEARLAVFTRAKLADQMLAALPAEEKTDWGLAFQRAHQNRRQGRHEEAWKIYTSAPTDAAVAGDLDDWWHDRQLAAYDALKLGQHAKAYEIVRDPGALSLNQKKEAAFLAGWLALRYLNDAKAAEGHFKALESIADGPLSIARAGYWLGGPTRRSISLDQRRRSISPPHPTSTRSTVSSRSRNSIQMRRQLRSRRRWCRRRSKAPNSTRSIPCVQR